MGTTVVAALLFDNRVIAAHVGDSRLYRLRAEKFEQVTLDHSLLQELVDRGFYSAEEAQRATNKNCVTRALGVEASVLEWIVALIGTLSKTFILGHRGIYFIIGDYIAHSVSMVAVMFFYGFIYERITLPRLLVGWFLVMGIYYIMLVLLQVTLFNIVVPGGATYLNYFSNVRLEFILVTFTTSLVLLALPERYRKPQWYEPKKAPRQNG